MANSRGVTDAGNLKYYISWHLLPTCQTHKVSPVVADIDALGRQVPYEWCLGNDTIFWFTAGSRFVHQTNRRKVS